MSALITHHMLDGTCVVCGTDREYGGSVGVEFVELESGSLVYWEIRLPGEGTVDETFAPSKREAVEHARSLHGRSATVWLLEDRLTLAAPPEESPAETTLSGAALLLVNFGAAVAVDNAEGIYRFGVDLGERALKAEIALTKVRAAYEKALDESTSGDRIRAHEFDALLNELGEALNPVTGPDGEPL